MKSLDYVSKLYSVSWHQQLKSEILTEPWLDFFCIKAFEAFVSLILLGTLANDISW